MNGSERIYPGVLDDGQGCIFGREQEKEVAAVKEQVKGWEEKVDEMRAAMNKQAVAFGVAALLLAIDIVLKLLPVGW